MALLLITLFLLIPYCLLILFYYRSWKSIKEFVPNQSGQAQPSVTIIIAARNEEKNIHQCIQSILDQTYPQSALEVIVVNDHSTDGTLSIIQSFQRKNIRLIDLASFTKNQILNSYKKKSIETAIQFAKGNLIVTTDADCVAPKKWIETLVSFYQQKKAIFVAMPVSFTAAKAEDDLFKKLLKIFQSLDFMVLQGITGASVSKKFHNMCNGANLFYEKKVFEEVGGFRGINEIASGDDMLLMHKIQKLHPDEIFFLKSRDAIVETQPAETAKDFLNQRIRWASKAGKYTDKKITSVLVLVYIFNLWLMILAISSFIFIKGFYLLLIAVAIKTMVEMIFLYPVAAFFQKRRLLWWFIPAQPFHILYTIIAGFLGMFGSYQWKGRRVK